MYYMKINLRFNMKEKVNVGAGSENCTWFVEDHLELHYHWGVRICVCVCVCVYIYIYIYIYKYIHIWGFLGRSVGKESACNARDPGSIPGLGSFPGKEIGYSPQNSWAPLLAQMVKKLPPMQETWVWSLGWEDPLEEGMLILSSILVWRIPMDRGA